MLKVAVGQSEDVQEKSALEEVLGQIRASLGELLPNVGILFCTLDFNHSFILNEIINAFPGIELIGCTTDGEMSSTLGFAEDSMAFIVFCTDNVEIHAGIGHNISDQDELAGREAASTARKKKTDFKKEDKFAIILSDPINAGVSSMSKGLQSILGKAFPLVGAASSAHSKLRTTYQFYNGEVYTDSIVLLLFSGPVVFSCGIQGGHSPMGEKKVVTKAERNIIYQVDHRPALEYFRHYIGEDVSLFMNYCLAVYENEREGFYVRSAPSCNQENGTVTLNGIVPEGAFIQIGTAQKESIIDSCLSSVQKALKNYPCSTPAVALLFSCAGRKLLLGTKTYQECLIIKNQLKEIPFCGFYAYGEFGPLDEGKESLFHGTTFVTLLIGPED